MASVKKAIADLTGSEEDKTKAKEQLDFLKNSAETKLQLISDEIEKKLSGQGDLNGLYIVPDSIVGTSKEYYVESGEGVSDAIKSAVDNFFSGSKDDVKAGFCKIVESALDTLLGNTEVGESQQDYYFVMMEHNAFVRVDIGMWKYYFSQKGIISDAQQALCYSFYKSVIDHTKVSEDTMIYLVSEYVGDDLEVVKKFMDEIRELYKDLEGTSPESNKAKFVSN